ncbi:MAG: hypothetical protein O6947_04440 [Acidobacteria bacterium]|nr:hypothetical protein [Acidobacteriota bacterium]
MRIGSGPGAVAAPAWPGIVAGFSVLAVFTVLLLRSFAPIESYDFWWHLETGGQIARNGALPVRDPFSFTVGGYPWIDHSWLFQVLIHYLHRAGRFYALGGFRLLLLSSAVLAMAIHLRRRGLSPAISSALILLALWGACFRSTLRPDLVSMVFTAVLLVLLIRAREGKNRAALLFAAGVMVPLWANLHIGAILAPALILPFCLERCLFRFTHTAAPSSAGKEGVGSVRSSLPFWVLLGWSVLGLTLNPWGWRPFAVVLRITKLTGQPFARNLEWGRPEFSDFPLFYFALIGILLLPLLFRRLADPHLFLAVSLLAAMSLTSIRFVGIFFFSLPFLLAPYAVLGASAAARLPVRPWVRSAISAAMVAILGVGLSMHVADRHRFRSDFQRPDRFPVGAVDFLERHRVGAERLFNDVKFGGYLIWRRFPDYQVFIDGRNEVYEQLLPEIFTAMESGNSWDRLMRKYAIDSALLRYPPNLTPVLYPGVGEETTRSDLRPFSTLYFPREKWALVYWDDAAMLFLKRTEANSAVIRETEYSSLRPDDFRHQLQRAMGESGFRSLLHRDLARKLEENPGCRRAARLRDLLFRLPELAVTRNVKP